MADLKRRIIAEFSAKNKAKGATASFRRDMDSTGQAMKRMATGALALAGVGGGLYALKMGFMGIVKAASDAEETQAKFNTVFKNLSEQANDWAESFGDSVGRSRQSVKSWMAGLQDTFVPLGIARDEALELAQSLTTLAVDVASFNNAVDANVIRDFTSALVGNHETVRKFGIIISESALKQEAMRQGIDKTYKELTDLEKVQLRYNLILAGTTDAQGDAIRTAESYANQMKRIRGTLDNIKVALGVDILPVLATCLENINTLLGENEKAVEAWGSTIGSAFVPALEQGIYPALKVVITTLGYLTTGIHTVRAGFMQLSGGALVASGGVIVAFGAIESALEKLNNAAAKSWLGKKLDLPVREKAAEFSAWGKALIEQGEALDKAAGEMMLNLPSLKISEMFEQLDKILRESQKRRKMMEGGDAETTKTIEEQYKDVLRAKRDMVEKEWAENEKRIAFLKQTEGFYLEATTEAHHKAAKEIDDVWREMENRRMEREWHVMRAPIIAAEKLEAEAAERRKRIHEDIALSMASSWTDALDQMWFESKKFGDAMMDMFRGLIREIAKIIMYKQLAEPLAEAIMGKEGKPGFAEMAFGAAMGGLGGLLRGGGGPLAGAPIQPKGQTVFAYPGMGGYQHGGVATRPHLAMVGEVPEAFVPLSGGRSIPVEMRGERDKSLQINVNYTGVERPVVTEAEEYILSDRRIIAVTLQAMQTDVRFRRSISQVRP